MTDRVPNCLLEAMAY